MAAASRKAARNASRSLRAASLGRRVVAFLIDWYVGSLATAAPIAAVAIYLGYEMTEQNIVDYPAPWGLIAGVAGVAVGLVYYVLVPMLTQGQTLGKRLLRLRIVSRDDGPATMPQLALRQMSIILLEQAAVGTSTVVQQVIALLVSSTVAAAIMWVGYALTLVSFAACGVTRGRRALHDLIAGTRVVPAA